MATFRKEPVVIEAVQFNNTPEFFNTLRSWEGHINPHTELRYEQLLNQVPTLVVKTLEGDMNVDFGDWIIKGVEDELYPCKPAIFEKSYVKVEDEEPATFLSELTHLINKYSVDSRVNMPDFIIAQFAQDAITDLSHANNAYLRWKGES